MEFNTQLIDPKKLLLDPNNFRFQESDDFVYADESRFAEDTVQEKAYQRLKQSESLKALKNSIISNNYIPSERIVVRKYSDDPERFLVIEGNRRTAAVKWIDEDYAAGAVYSKNVIGSINELPCMIVESDEESKIIHASLMGIRHVSGIKQWGGYQRAKLVVTMRDELGLNPNDTADRLGMSTHEVNRRYRAFKALQQFKEHEEYGDHFKPSLYPLFHEAVSLSPVKEWLHWSEEYSKFENESELDKFYDLLTPSRIDSGDDDQEHYPPKIATYSHVRELKSILPNPDAFESLINDKEASFDETLAIAKQPEIARNWLRTISAAKRNLEEMSIKIIKEISDDDLQTLKDLQSVINERINDIEEFKKR